MHYITAIEEPVEFANCSSCPLYGEPKVDSYGKGTSIMIIGDSPSAQDVRTGKPFSGNQGNLLNRLLADTGINKDTCYFANVCLCHAEDNSSPKATSVKACQNRLFKEIETIKPKVIITLGAVALRAVAKRNGLNQWHGAIIKEGEYTIVPTYHPLAILKNMRLYPQAKADIDKAYDIYKGTYCILDQVANVNYKVYTDPLELFKILPQDRPIALDVETASDGYLLCIGFSWQDGYSHILTNDFLNDSRVVSKFNNILKDLKLIGHNLKSDIQVLWRHGMTNAYVYADTMLEHYLLNEIPGTHGLKQLAREYLNAPEYDKPVKEYYKIGFENCPKDVLYLYNACDDTYTYQLHNIFMKKLTDKQKNILDTILIPASNALAQIEYTGAMIDVNYLNTLSVRFDNLIQIAQNRMFTTLGHEFNPKSTNQLLDILYKELDLPVPGKLSTDKDHLKLLMPYSDFVKYLMTYKKLTKLKSTYINNLLKARDINDRVHTNFNIHGTVSGRLSSSNPLNLQNIPKKGAIRNIFIASPGYTLIECDQKQAEVRTLALYSQDKELINTIKSGVDMHIRTASLMYNVKPEDVTKHQRQTAKKITFGIIYGMSAETLAQDLKISVSEAEENIEKFFGAYKRAQEWIKDTQNFALEHGYVETPLGRIRRFGYITNENKAEVMRQAVNMPIQSLASDITLSALIEAQKQLGTNKNTRILLTVHDSILMETNEDVKYWAKWLHDIMSRPVLDGSVPFEADVAAGNAWGNLHEVELP